MQLQFVLAQDGPQRRESRKDQHRAPMDEMVTESHTRSADQWKNKSEEKKLSRQMKQRNSWAKLVVLRGTAIDLETIEHELAPEVVSPIVPPMNDLNTNP